MSGCYISNGTMGDMWQEANCNGCVKDHSWHTEYNAEDQCPVFNAMLLGEYPIEGLIRHADKRWPAALECTYHEPCGCEP